MKYLDFPVLTHLSDALSDLPTPEYRIRARVEAYSVKPIQKERKMYKEMEQAYHSESEGIEEMSFSPEMREAGLSSAFGRLDEKESRKVHFLIVSLLNTAFPGHEFSALRPDQFTRERSAAQVLANVTSQFASYTGNTAPQIIAQVAMSPALKASSLPGIHQTMSSSLGSSPINPPPSMANADLYRLLSDILPLEDSECEVYSWFPEPEYDPHLEPEDDEMSDEEYDEEVLVDETRAEEMDLDDPSWGQAGMELDDVPTMVKKNSSDRMKAINDAHSTASRDVFERKKARLYWSQNYFFYSRRMKRVLFFSCWCRKRPSNHSSSLEDDSDAFPQPISSSFTPPSAIASPIPRQTRQKVHRLQRRSKLNLHTEKGDLTATIPIRGAPTTPRPSRLATSAPSAFMPTPSPQASQAALAKMTAGGFRPRQTPARVMLNAASASNRPRDVVDLTGSNHSVSSQRVRKERSESATPGPGSITNTLLLDNAVPADNIQNSNTGKRVKT